MITYKTNHPDWKLTQLFWTSQLLYKSCILCTKESICFLYLRLFSVGHRRFRITVISSMVFIALYYIIAILLTIFQCTPVKKSWEKQIPGTCIQLQTFFFANAAFNVITDILVMVLPIPVISKLQITRKQRIGLGLIFCVGILATATSIVRMTTLQTGSKSTDITWTTTDSTIWSGIEINVAIVCACLPILRAPLQAIFPRLFGRTTVSSKTATDCTHGASGGGWSRIATGAMRSKADDKDVDGLDMGAVGGKGLGLEKIMTPGGESGSEDGKYILGDEESAIGVAVARGEARQTERSRARGSNGELGAIEGAIVKTTNVGVDYGKA